MDGNQVAWAMAAVVIIAVIAVLAYQYLQQQQALRQSNDPGRNIGQGIGLLAQGIFGAVAGVGHN
jgi:type II secretory pathway component PulJ